MYIYDSFCLMQKRVLSLNLALLRVTTRVRWYKHTGSCRINQCQISDPEITTYLKREFSSCYFSSLVTVLPVKQWLATTLWKGYQVSGCSVFKCEMSSKVVRHMIWVTAWQRCTYGADLEDRKREEHDNLSTLHCTTVTSWRSVLLSKHRMVISTVRRPYSNILGYSEKK